MMDCTIGGMFGDPPDKFKQHVPGLRWYKIDGIEVTKEEFDRRLAAFIESSRGT